MDIDLLSKMVKELILDNDRVVLPGLGAFVAEIVPSTFSDKGYTINPPYRRMYFRSKPDDGDELIEFYAAGNNLERVVAERIIRDYVLELKSILHTKKTVVFPGLGRLRATKENNIFFVADEDLDIYPDGFGLEPISLKTHQETREEVAAAVEDLKSMLEPVTATEPVSPLEPVTATEPEEIVGPETVTEPISEPEDVLPIDPEVRMPLGIEPEIPEPTVDPEPPAEPAAPETPVTTAVPVTVRKPLNVKKILLAIFGIILALALIALAALAIAGRTNPEFVDRFLYTQEELKILNHIL